MRLIAYTIIVASVLALATGQLREHFQWHYIDYLWESADVKAEAVKSGRYNFGAVLPMDVDVDRSGRVFVTFIGKAGVPATLGIVTNVTGPSGPLIRPYPDWSWFTKDNCNSMHNVYRIAIDECNRLFVLDVGFEEGQPIKCDPQILIFDLTNDRYIQTIKIPRSILQNNVGISLLANPIVETEGPYCEKSVIYISDPFSNALVVVTDTRIFRLENQFFEPNPQATYVTSGGVTFDVGGGLLGMALSPRIFPDEARLLYFRPLSSYDLFVTSTSSIQNNVYGPNLAVQGKQNIFSSQVVTMAFSSEGTMFYGLTRENAIGCWNKYVPLEPQALGIVAKDNEALQYLNGVKVIKATPAHPEEELWVLSNRFVGYMAGVLDANNINFRVIKGSVKSLISGTKCDMPLNIKQLLQNSRNRAPNQPYQNR